MALKKPRLEALSESHRGKTKVFAGLLFLGGGREELVSWLFPASGACCIPWLLHLPSSKPAVACSLLVTQVTLTLTVMLPSPTFIFFKPSIQNFIREGAVGPRGWGRWPWGVKESFEDGSWAGLLCPSGVEGKRARISEVALPVVWGTSLASFSGTVVDMGPQGLPVPGSSPIELLPEVLGGGLQVHEVAEATMVHSPSSC